MYDIITVGSATRDVFVQSKALEVCTVNDSDSHGFHVCFPLGSKVGIEDLLFETGGGATNTAMAFSNFGMKTAIVCRIGSDIGGKDIVRLLNDAHIDTQFITVDAKKRTDYSIILLTKTGERTILVYRGASTTMRATLVPWGKLNAQWIYVSSLAGNLEMLTKAFIAATRRDMDIGWNPGTSELKLGFMKLSPFLKKTSVLVMNEEEVTMLMPSAKSLRAAAHELRFLPRKALVITRGSEGAWVVTHDNAWEVDALGKGKEVNTTGAGDAFASGFIAGLWKWGDVQVALVLGALNSGNVVQHMGAKRGLLKKLPSKAVLEKIFVRTIAV